MMLLVEHDIEVLLNALYWNYKSILQIFLKKSVAYKYKVIHLIFETYRSTQQNTKKTNSFN